MYYNNNMLYVWPHNKTEADSASVQLFEQVLSATVFMSIASMIFSWRRGACVATHADLRVEA